MNLAWINLSRLQNKQVLLMEGGSFIQLASPTIFKLIELLTKMEPTKVVEGIKCISFVYMIYNHA